LTIVLPSGNVLPLGGVQLIEGALQPPLAVLEKNTATPFELLAVTVRFDEQVRSMGGRATVTWKLQLVDWLQVSLALQKIVVLPIGNVLPLGGVQLIEGRLQPPVAVDVKYTLAPLELVAAAVMFDEHVRLMGGRTTVTLKLQFVNWLQASLAEQLTIVLPTGNVLPLGGIQLTIGGGLQPPVAVLVKNTKAPLGLLAATVMFDGHARLMGGRATVTFTLKLQLVNWLQVSLATQLTVVMPAGNVLPLGGMQLTTGVLQPPVAVVEKNTTAPPKLLVVTEIFEEHVRSMGGKMAWAEGRFTVTWRTKAAIETSKAVCFIYFSCN